MLKYYDYATVFQEFPDEITLAINISNCPGTCEECSEPWLRQDIGTLLTNEEIDKLITTHPDITVFGLMGGDIDHQDCKRIARHIHSNYPNIKVGMYSGQDYLDIELLDCLDLYKIGKFIMPHGSKEEWHKTNCGPIVFPWSNQLLFEKIDNKWFNITYKFRKESIGDPTRYIIQHKDL